MQIREVSQAEEWDRALLALPNPHVLQSWTWGEFKSRHGWNITRLLFEEGDRTVAAGSVLQRRAFHLPISILYIPKGPALDWSDEGLTHRVLAVVECLARRRRALFVKVDPDIYYPDAAPSFAARPACGPGVAGLLAGRGWRFSSEQIQFRNTVLLDLDQTEEELLAAMRQKARYNVRLATRRGVTVRAGSAEEVELFYRIYAETAQRDGFLVRPPAYYLDAWRSFLAGGQRSEPSAEARLLLAEVEGEVVAGVMLFVYGRAAWYMYGASTDRHRQWMPNQLLQWEAIRQAKAAGCTLYDLWGAGEGADESDPMWGVVRFKLDLGGQFARGLGAWDYAPSRLAYWLYTVVLPRYLARLRARHQTLGGTD